MYFAEYQDVFQTNVATLKLSEINVEDDIVIDDEKEKEDQDINRVLLGLIINFVKKNINN